MNIYGHVSLLHRQVHGGYMGVYAGGEGAISGNKEFNALALAPLNRPVSAIVTVCDGLPHLERSYARVRA
jgi:hypothetical protein